MPPSEVKKLLYFILLLSIIYSCQDSIRTSYVHNIITIDGDVVEDLSEVIEDVQVLKLGEPGGCFINYISKLQFYNDRIYIKNLKYNVIVFSSSGECLFTFDRLGEGPGKYDSFADFNINPWTGNIEILAHFGVFYKYDSTGNFIESRRINMPDDVVTFQRFKRISDEDIILYQWGFDTNLLYIYSFSRDTMMGSYVMTLDHNGYHNHMLEEIAYVANGSYRYFNDQTNTIYNVTQDSVVKYKTLAINGNQFNWHQYQTESSPDEMVWEYIEINKLNHPIFGFASDFSIIAAYHTNKYQYYIRSQRHDGRYLVLSEHLGNHKFNPYIYMAESREPNGDMRLYGVIYDKSAGIDNLEKISSIDSTELQLLNEFNPGYDNPILFSYKLKKDI